MRSLPTDLAPIAVTSDTRLEEMKRPRLREGRKRGEGYLFVRRGAYLLSAARAILMWSMHSDQSSSITSVSASLSALRNVTSTGAE